MMGFFLLLLGNYFQTIKQNYFLGIKTPWTLHSEEIWRKTHRLASKLMMIGGLVIIASFFIVGKEISKVFLLSVIFSCSLIPLAYSFFLYRKDIKNAKENQYSDKLNS